MKKTEKIISTIAIIFGFLIVAGLFQAGIQASNGGGAPIIGLMFIGVVYGIRTIWKSKKNEDSSDDLPSEL